VGGEGGGGVGGQPHLVNLGLLESLGLGPTVLEPDFDLRFRQLEVLGELGPLGDGQVLLLLELVLQGEELLGGERGSGLAIGLVLAEVAAEGKPRVAAEAVVEGCRRCRHGCRAAVSKHGVGAEGKLVLRRRGLAERRNPR